MKRVARLICLIFVLLLYLPLTGRATGVIFLKDGQWNLALAKAKMQKKPIFVFGHTSWCGYCKQMDKEVFSSTEAGSAFNSAFINISLDMEKGDGLRLSKLMNITAQNLKEPGLDGLLSTYLAKQPSIVKNADLLDIFFRYNCLATKPQMAELYDFAAGPKLERSLKEFMLEKLLEKLTNMAYDKSFNKLSKELNFDAFKMFIAEFRPEIAARETQKQKIVYYTGKVNYKQATIELLLFLEAPEFKPGARQLSQMMKKYSSMLRKNGNLELFVKKVESYILKPEDKMNGSYKTMALMYLYDNMENR